MKRVIDLLSAGYRHEYDKRFETMQHWVNMHAHLPRGARVLLHDNHTHLGLAAETVSDWGGWQFGISYGRHRTPRQVYDLLRGMGVTHISWDRTQSNGWDSIAGDIMFFEFALREAVDRQVIDGAFLARMPSAPPAGPFDDRVAMLGCKNLFKSGLYKIEDSHRARLRPEERPLPRAPHRGAAGRRRRDRGAGQHPRAGRPLPQAADRLRAGRAAQGRAQRARDEPAHESGSGRQGTSSRRRRPRQRESRSRGIDEDDGH